MVPSFCMFLSTHFICLCFLSIYYSLLGDVLCAALLSDGVQLTEHLSNQVQAASMFLML